MHPDARPHFCHAMGCSVRVKRTMLMCHEHWAMVPADAKVRVTGNYQAGQCDGRVRVTRAWMRAAREAINAVAVAEGRMTQAQADAWPKVTA